MHARMNAQRPEQPQVRIRNMRIAQCTRRPHRVNLGHHANTGRRLHEPRRLRRYLNIERRGFGRHSTSSSMACGSGIQWREHDDAFRDARHLAPVQYASFARCGRRHLTLGKRIRAALCLNLRAATPDPIIRDWATLRSQCRTYRVVRKPEPQQSRIVRAGGGQSGHSQPVEYPQRFVHAVDVRRTHRRLLR